MNLEKLKNAESNFFEIYPEGFNTPEMIQLSKKHKMEKMISFVQEAFAEDQFDNPNEIIDNMIKTVSRSSMVSVFEKLKFKTFVMLLLPERKAELAGSLREILHGNEEKGFNAMLEILLSEKLAKWPLMTVYQVYFNPDKDLLIKPTTVKDVLKYFEIQDLTYKSKPSYEFYKKYRDLINEMKSHVSSSLSPNNAAFSGFLMMSIPK